MANSRCTSSQGVALVLVMVCLLALSGLVFASAKLAYQESEDVVRLRDEYQPDLLAESGLELAKELIEYDNDPASDTLDEPWTFPIVKDELKVSISPCNARVDLNLTIGCQRCRIAVQRMLFNLLLLQREEPLDKSFTPGSFEFTRATGQVIRLQDWIDGDNEERVEGSEREDYEDQKLWNKPRNGVLVVPEEASLVKFWDSVPIEWIRDHGTAFVGSEQVNINFVSEEVFCAMFPELCSAWSQVKSYRESFGFTDISQLKSAAPDLAADEELFNTLSKFITVQSDVFRVMVEVELPLIYEKRRYILKRLDDGFEVIRGDVLEVRQR